MLIFYPALSKLKKQFRHLREASVSVNLQGAKIPSIRKYVAESFQWSLNETTIYVKASFATGKQPLSSSAHINESMIFFFHPI